MIKIKTADAIGPALDWLVAQAIDQTVRINISRTSKKIYIICGRTGHEGTATFKPSTDWLRGGPIIEREKIALRAYAHETDKWSAEPSISTISLKVSAFRVGPTPLIAAMRCYVASKLGDEVEVPEELL